MERACPNNQLFHLRGREKPSRSIEPTLAMMSAIEVFMSPPASGNPTATNRPVERRYDKACSYGLPYKKGVDENRIRTAIRP